MPTTRSANAVVINNTGRTIRAVSIVHKYSDVFKSRHDYAELAPGASTPRASVRYNTGFGTTGRDWWVITWYSDDYTRRYCSNPENFRETIDILEEVAPSVLSYAAGKAAKDPSVTKAAETVAEETSKLLFNTESTAGFKQHILRTSDQNGDVSITLNDDESIVIRSPSGTSETRYSAKATGIRPVSPP